MPAVQPAEDASDCGEGEFMIEQHRPRYGRDLVGERFGRMVVLAQAPSARYTRWRCRCDCGAEIVVSRQLLIMREKGTRSCGCLRLEQRRDNLARLRAEGRLRGRAAVPEQRFDASALLAVIGPKP